MQRLQRTITVAGVPMIQYSRDNGLTWFLGTIAPTITGERPNPIQKERLQAASRAKQTGGQKTVVRQMHKFGTTVMRSTPGKGKSTLRKLTDADKAADIRNRYQNETPKSEVFVLPNVSLAEIAVEALRDAIAAPQLYGTRKWSQAKV